MSKSTNYLTTTHLEYQALIPAMKGYRKALKAAIGAGFKYNRIFTEPRMYGARTKFWFISRSIDPKVINSAVYEYTHKHPAIVVNGITYEVTAKWDYMSSLSLHFKAVSRIEKGVKLRRGTPLVASVTIETSTNPTLAECFTELEKAIEEWNASLDTNQTMLDDFKSSVNTLESTINNNNNMHISNNPSTSAIAHNMLKLGKQRQSLHLSGEMVLGTIAINGINVYYEGSADLEDNGDISVEVAEWYYDVQKGHPFSQFKYEEMKRAIDAIIMSTNPQITNIEEFDAAVENEVANVLKEQATKIFYPKPAVVADPKPAFDPQEFYEFMIGHGLFQQTIARAAEQIAEELESDPESFVDLSMTHNQVEIDIDSRCIERTITRYFEEEFEEGKEDNFVQIFTEFMHNKALQASK